MQPVLVAIAGLYVAVGFVVLFRRLRCRTVQFDVSDPRSGDPLAWIAVAALWPLYFRDHCRKDGIKPDRND